MSAHTILAFTLSILSSQSRQAPVEEARPWTVLVYGAADNNCDGPLLEYVERVRAAIDDDPGIELLLFIDRHHEFSDDAEVLGEDFTGSRLYRIAKSSAERLDGGELFAPITLEEDVELDSADPGTLRRFIAWGKARSPDRRHALIVYGHANGESMCPDVDSGRRMGIAALTDAASDAESVDFMALELCAMGGIEIGYQWRPGTGRFGADVLLAVPNSGPPLDWDRVFARMRSPGHASAAAEPHLDPARMSAADFGRLVIEEAGRGRELAGERAMHEAAGCYDLREAASVKQTVDALAVALSSSPDAREFFLEMRGPGPIGSAMQYGEPFFVDLYDLCRRTGECDAFSAEVRRSCERVLDALDRFVIASFGMSGYAGFQPGKNGVFIVVPPESGWEGLSFFSPLACTEPYYGRWAFLADGATRANGVVENWFELIDAWFDAPDETGGLNGYRW